MILNWTEQRVKIVPAGNKDKVLYPGANEVTDEEYKAMEPSIKMDMALNRIVVLKAVEGKPLTASTATLEDLKKMVKETNNLETLKAWLEDEKRPNARRLIDKRIEEIEKEFAKGNIEDLNEDSEG